MLGSSVVSISSRCVPSCPCLGECREPVRLWRRESPSAGGSRGCPPETSTPSAPSSPQCHISLTSPAPALLSWPYRRGGIAPKSLRATSIIQKLPAQIRDRAENVKKQKTTGQSNRPEATLVAPTPPRPGDRPRVPSTSSGSSPAASPCPPGRGPPASSPAHRPASSRSA